MAIEILLGNQEVEKESRKISGSRLSKLKDIKSMLDDVLSGLDDTPKEASDVAQGEVRKVVREECLSANNWEIGEGREGSGNVEPSS